MGNLINLPNITPEAIAELENNSQSKKKTNGFDTRNYLNVRLDEAAGETEKTLTIRLLPMDLKTGNPFVKVHFHTVRVPKDVSKSTWKSYVCLSKNDDIDHAKFGYKCPFCELNKTAYEESTKTDDPVQKKNWQDVSIANLSREAVIVRCIERGKEEEGVKFWKFNLRNDKTDPYNQIIKLYNLRKDAAAKKGKVENILDIYDGRDLTITITEGNAAPQIVDDSDRSPLSENEEQMKNWIYDEKKWQDVFVVKPYDYMDLVSQMKVPWYDKQNNRWIDKDVFDSANDAAEKEYDEAEQKAEQRAVANAVQNTMQHEDLTESLEVNEDGEDLPF